MSKTQWKALGFLLALVLAFGGGLYVANESHQSIASAQTTGVTTTVVSPDTSAGQPAGVDMTQFWQAYQLLNQNFVVTHASSTFPTQQEQMWGAIEGLTASFGDPYTVFLPPSDAAVFNQDIAGSFGGVGMEVDDNASGQLVAVSALKGTPAATAGIESGDLILAIGTTTTDGLSVDDAVKLIRGPVGSSITLTLEHSGQQHSYQVTITRAIINEPIIDTQALPNGIFEITFYSFSENSADLFQSALRQFVQSGDHKLLLDMRGNPGGYLDAAVDIASYFLPVGDTVVTEDFEGKQDNIVHRSYGYNVFANDPQFKMAILVDQDSASAAEILSGALQQHGVAKLVGTRTFGKGSVQELMDMGGGAELKITIARWLTPNGTSISDGGLMPDIAVSASTTPAQQAAGDDPQLNAAEQYLLGQ